MPAYIPNSGTHGGRAVTYYVLIATEEKILQYYMIDEDSDDD